MGSHPQGPLPRRVRTALEEMDAKGEFKRKESQFRNFIKKGGEFEPEGKWRWPLGRLRLCCLV